MMLTETKTSEGRSWLGGVFALRSPRWLELGMKTCRKVFRGRILSSGYSQGQGIILKRSLWNALGQILLYHHLHSRLVIEIREWVTQGLGKRDYVTTASEVFYSNDTEEMRAKDA